MARKRNVPDVGCVLAALDQVAPLAQAADWDNVGLIAGRPEWTAARGLLALDLTDAVAREALRQRVSLILLYHPPILKGVRCIAPGADAPCSLLPDLLAARVALLAVHTALDAAPGGTNDVLLDAFEPVERYPLEPLVQEGRDFKLVTFVPPAQAELVREVLAGAGAGVIGHYTECSFELPGRGTFRGDASTKPAVGRRGRLERVDEVRVEMIVPRARLGPVVRALYAAHPYEEPAFDVYPVQRVAGRAQAGMGRVGVLRGALRGEELVRRLGQAVDLSGAQVVGTLGRRFRSVTAAAGSFGVRSFRDPDSLVVTGEFKHHDALELLKRGVTAVHVGHWASERPVLEWLRARLAALVPGLRVRISRRDRGPLVPIHFAQATGGGSE